MKAVSKDRLAGGILGILLALAWGACSTPASAQLTSVWVSPETESTQAAAWADFDLDGDPDVAMGNDAGQPKRVFRNDGNGVFTAVWSSAELENVTGMAAGDYDGDGDPDMAFSIYNAPVRIYRNNGGMNFSLFWSAPQSAQAYGAAWGDADLDGSLDLAVGSNGQNRMYQNLGAAGFALKWTASTTEWTTSVDFADMDADGDPDLAAGVIGPNRIYRNAGSWTFPLQWTSPQSESTWSVRWGDIDNDGDPDLAAGNLGQANRVYRNEGGTAFVAFWAAPVARATVPSTWGDYDNDGDLDLAFGNRNQTNQVYGNSGGTLQQVWVSAETSDTWAIDFGNYDLDGDLDLFVGNTNNKANRIYHNDLNPLFRNPSPPRLRPKPNDSVGVQTLDWSAGTDAVSPAALLEYDVRIGRTSGGCEIFCGSAGPKLSYARTFAATGTYYWSVRTVSPIQLNSAWSAEDSFDLFIPTFTLDWTSAEAEGTQGLGVADFDGDGDPDVVAGNDVNQPYRLYVNNNFQSFSSGWTSAEKDSTAGIAAGDVNGDGRPDFVAANLGNPKRAYAASGSGFNLIWSSTEIDNSYGVDLADMDADGDLDLAFANFANDRVYRNNGAGQFAAVWSAPVNVWTPSVTWTDFDLDGMPDLAMANVGVNRTFKNTGAGTFSAGWTSSQSDNSWSVDAADFDLDGDPDLAVGNISQPNRVYANDGSGTFALHWSTTDNDATIAFPWGDYDSDGRPDLAAGNRNQPNRVYRNTPTEGFKHVWSSPELDDTWAIAWINFDADNDLDLFAGNTNNKVNRLYRNNVNPPFNRPTPPALVLEPDNDGPTVTLEWKLATDPQTRAETLTYELCAGTSPGGCETFCGPVGAVLSHTLPGLAEGDYYWTVRTVDADGLKSDWQKERSFAVHQPLLVSHWTSPEAEDTHAIDAGDCDGDGDLDLVLGSDPGQRVYANDGTGLFSTAWTNTASDHTTSVDFGDYNNDGRLDVLAANWPQPNRILRNGGSCAAFVSAWTGPDSLRHHSVAWGDYDNDGDLDFASGNDSNDPNQVFRNDGAAGFALAYATPEKEWTKSVDWGDYDNDGDLDLAVGNYDSKNNQLPHNRTYRNDGGGAFVSVWVSPEFDSAFTVKWADVDADRDLDILVANSGIHSLSRNRVYLNQGSGRFEPGWQTSVENSTISLCPGDVNGDGKLDFLEGNYSTLHDHPKRLQTNDGAGNFYEAWAAQAADDSWAVVCGDFNGDLKLEFAAANTNHQVNRVYRNEAPYTDHAPAAPGGLTVALSFGGRANFQWTPGSDAETPANLLTYDLRVGLTSGGCEVFCGSFQNAGPAPKANGFGNVGQNLKHRLFLDAGTTYYWSVRTADASMNRGPWSQEKSFLMGDPPATEIPTLGEWAVILLAAALAALGAARLTRNAQSAARAC